MGEFLYPNDFDGTLTSDLNVTVYVQPVNDAPTIEIRCIRLSSTGEWFN